MAENFELGNIPGERNITNMSNIMGNMNVNKMTNVMKNQGNKLRKGFQNASNKFMGLSKTMRIIIIVAIIAIIAIFFFVMWYQYKLQQEYEFANQPLFMTEIEDDLPHDTKKIYCYTNTSTGSQIPHIPGSLLPETNGQQYTYSFWMYIDSSSWNYRFNDWKHIMHRGTTIPGGDCNNPETISEENIDVPFQAPGFWLAPKTNSLHCVFNTTQDEERLVLEDIELNRWINITVVVNGRSVTLYKNGEIEKIIALFYPLITNTDNLFINYYGGFAGNMAYLQYFNTALTPENILSLYKQYSKKINKYVQWLRSGSPITNGNDNNNNNNCS